MTDRELLEKAAKAAGIDVPKKLNNWLTYDDKYGFQWWNMDGTRTEKTFNPLNDDGDALRLAVKLQLTVANEHVSAGVAYCTDVDDNVFQVVRSGGNQSEVIAEDYAATRRAIVRAAAAIGETL